MENLVIFLVMFVTIVGPLLLFLSPVLVLAVVFHFLAKRGKISPTANRIVRWVALAIVAILLIPETIAVIALLILFQLFGRG